MPRILEKCKQQINRLLTDLIALQPELHGKHKIYCSTQVSPTFIHCTWEMCCQNMNTNVTVDIYNTVPRLAVIKAITLLFHTSVNNYLDSQQEQAMNNSFMPEMHSQHTQDYAFMQHTWSLVPKNIFQEPFMEQTVQSPQCIGTCLIDFSDEPQKTLTKTATVSIAPYFNSDSSMSLLPEPDDSSTEQKIKQENVEVEKEEAPTTFPRNKKKTTLPARYLDSVLQ